MVAIIIIIIAYSYSLWRFFVWILQDSPWFSGILFNYCHFYLDLILKNILETCFGWILSHCLGALWTLWHIWDSSFFRIILSFWGFLEILFDSFFFFGGLNGIASGGYESLVVFKDSLWCLGILGDFLFPFCSKGLSVGIIWDFAWTVTSSSILVSILRDSFEISANSLGILPRCCCYLFLSQI